MNIRQNARVMMVLITIALGAPLAGCDGRIVDPTSAVYNYSCTDEQFAKASSEAKGSIAIDKELGAERMQHWPAFWLASAIMRNCSPNGEKP